MAAPLAVLVALLVGSVPTGYLVARRLRGVDIHRLSPHNLGLLTVARAAGVPTLVVVTVADLAKGAGGVLLAARIASGDWAVAASAAGVVLGHVYSPYWLLVARAYTRMKGVVVGVGALIALALLDVAAWYAAIVPVVVGGVLLVGPRLISGRWGYLSLGAVGGAVALPLTLVVTGTRPALMWLSVAYALITIWNHKEHLLRIADGVEPRLGDRLPLPSLGDREAACAFLIHPMTVDYIWLVDRFAPLAALRRLGLLPDGPVRWLARFLRPMKVDELRTVTADGRAARIYLIGVAMLPDQIRSNPALAVRRAVEAAHLAASLGATVLGLGAYWSVVGNKGVDVQAQSPIAITNGGAYTAGTVKRAVPFILERLRARGGEVTGATAAVVGANGVVGFGICRALLGHVGRLIMVGTDQERLERSRELLARRAPGAVIEATVSYDPLREADVIFTATSHPRPVLFPQHVRPGALVFDLGRPPDVDPSVAAVPGVEVIPGGVVRLPGRPDVPVYFDYSQYGPGLVPACLAETVIIALDNAYDRVSLGDRTRSEHVDYFVERAEALGFEVATGARAAETVLAGRGSERRRGGR
jgi:predicted amino acid dehydrogenase